MTVEALIGDSAGDSSDVVIADKGLRQEGFAELGMALEAVGELKQVALVDGVENSLPQFILRHGIEARFGDVSRVITMDHFADKPGVGKTLAEAGEHGGPETSGHCVGGIEAPTVCTAGEPVRHGVGDVLLHGGGVEVEPHKRVVSFEGIGAGSVGWVAEEEPFAVAVARFRGDCALEQGIAATHVVEHPVENHTDAAGMSLLDQGVEVVLGAEARIDGEVVNGVVAVGFRRKHRAEQECVAAELDEVVKPVSQGTERTRLGGVGTGRGVGAEETQGIDLPPHGVLCPRNHPYHPSPGAIGPLHAGIKASEGVREDAPRHTCRDAPAQLPPRNLRVST